jgi:hypothetical protein
MSQLDAAIRFCGLFEAEVLVDLMLRYWAHPCAGDKEATNYLVEAAAEILKQARDGHAFIEGVDAEDMNFIAAVWYAEFCHVADSHDPDVAQRQAWLKQVRRALPSCFCDPSNLV